MGLVELLPEDGLLHGKQVYPAVTVSNSVTVILLLCRNYAGYVL